MAKLVLIKDNQETVTIRKDVSENINPLDVFIRSDFIAMKTWSREDIATSLRNEGYKDTEENITAVINSMSNNRDLRTLEDCTDAEWEVIWNAIDRVADTLVKHMSIPTNFSRITESPSSLAQFVMNFKNTFGEECEGEQSLIDWLYETSDDINQEGENV